MIVYVIYVRGGIQKRGEYKREGNTKERGIQKRGKTK
jgi:hypothetical protein